MVDHEGLYQQMVTSLLDFIVWEKMKMLDHGDNTNLNDVLNNSVAGFAPKNECLSGTMSLEV